MDHTSSTLNDAHLLADDGDEPVLASECMSLHDITLASDEVLKTVPNHHQLLLNLGKSSLLFEKRYKDDGDVICLKPMQGLVISAKDKYQWRSQQSCTLLQAALDQGGFENFSYAEVQHFADELLTTTVVEEQDLGRCATWLNECLNHRESYSFVVVESLTRMVLVKFVQYLLDCRQGKKTTMLATSELQSIVGFIKSRFGESLSLDDIASHTQMSVSYFSRLFRFAVGMSPVQFLNAFRIEQAKKMLVSAEKRSIGEIASSVGFPDQPHFGKMFKKSVGMSPGVYRKNRH